MFYTDDWGSYERNLDPKQHTIGKKNTQAIERKNLTLINPAAKSFPIM